MKTDKYLLSLNPLNPDKRIFILHTDTPKILAEVFHFGLYEDKAWQDCQKGFDICESVRYKNDLICICAVWIGETTTDLEATDKLTETMSGMRDWYYDYLSKEVKENK